MEKLCVFCLMDEPDDRIRLYSLTNFLTPISLLESCDRHFKVFMDFREEFKKKREEMG